MHQYLIPLYEKYTKNAHPDNAANMAAYMKNKFEFIGIKTPDRREINKNFFSVFGEPEETETVKIAKECWELHPREFQYFAMELLTKYAKKAPPDRIDFYEYLITTKSWWDTVDLISTKLVGEYFKRYPRQIEPVTTQWMASGNIWLQRTCLLFQLLWKEKTDIVLLHQFIEQLAGSREFFINKAIGWILRQYSKTNAAWVIDYVNKHQLAPLSEREALKWLKNQGEL